MIGTNNCLNGVPSIYTAFAIYDILNTFELKKKNDQQKELSKNILLKKMNQLENHRDANTKST